MILIVALFIYVTLLIYWGSRSHAGFASWHMFADLHKVEFHIECQREGESWQKLNPWDFLPHTHLSMNLSEFKIFMRYLHKEHGLKLRGHAILYSSDSVNRLVIRAAL